MTTSKPKREFERHSGTGGPIKGDAKRSGGGQHNWGDDQEVIGDAVVAHKEAAAVAATQPTANSTNPPPPKDDLVPESLGDLADAEPKPNDMSYEEYMKQQQQNRTGVKAYDTRTVAANFRPDRYKGKNYFEKATDELLQGAQKEKKKRKKPKKQQKIIKPEYSFHPASGHSDYREGGAPRTGGRGRGRGRGGGEGGFNSNRQYGSGGGGGDRGGYSRGYGGFGSRGRGRRNDENVDSDMPPQRPPPQYRLKNEAGGDAPAPPPNNNESLNLPQPIA